MALLSTMLDFLNSCLEWMVANDVTFAQVVFNTILAVIAIFVVVMMWKLNRRNGEYQQFKVMDLIRTRRGRISRPALMEMGAWVIMSWTFVVLVDRDKLADWYAAIYVGAFVLRGAYSAYLQSKQTTRRTEE